MIAIQRLVLNIVLGVSLIICAASASFGAEKLQTTTKKVPSVRKVDSLAGITDKDYRRWQIACICGDLGMMVEFRTPEFCASEAKRQAKVKLLGEEDTNKIWEDLKKYQTDDKSVIFVGCAYFRAKKYTLEQAKEDRMFYIEIDGDKRYKPEHLELSDIKVQGSGETHFSVPLIFGSFDYSESNEVYVREFAVRFLNTDADGKPLLTDTTKSVALIVAGETYRGRAKWEFPNPNKKR